VGGAARFRRTPDRGPIIAAPPAPEKPEKPEKKGPPRKGRDPYERVDEPKKGSDIINPY